MLGWLIGRVGIDNLIRSGRLAEALILIERRLDAGDKDLSLAQRRARVLEALGRRDEAMHGYLDVGERLASQEGGGVLALQVLARARSLSKGDAIVTQRIRSLSALARIDVLHASPLFAEMPRSDVVDLLLSLEAVVWSPGEILMTEGEPGDVLYVLGAGSVKVYRAAASGRNHHLRDLVAPVVIGELAVLDAGPRTATITAAEEVEALALPGARLDELRRTHASLGAALEAIAARRRG